MCFLPCIRSLSLLWGPEVKHAAQDSIQHRLAHCSSSHFLFGAPIKPPHGVTSYGVCDMRVAQTMLLKGFHCATPRWGQNTGYCHHRL